jgi:prepilin signal peptidase PulO-like enzyme (type II secretory pathway)
MAVPLDPIGNISLSLQVVILFLLILGLPSIRGSDGNRNASQHGYLTILALVIHTVLIVIVMVPTFVNGIPDIGALPPLYMFNVVSHIVLGTLAEVLGLVVVGYWLLKSPKKMMCFKMRRWMTPIFIVWVISLINGALVHIFGML